jgi:hypothetical protein
MNANVLTLLFDDWRETTRAEEAAIASQQWPEVAAHQQHKRDLQRKITLATEAWQRSWPRTGETLADYERRFRPIVGELIELEAWNASLIEGLRAQSNNELDRMGRTVTTLHGVRRAYGTGSATHWASYS